MFIRVIKYAVGLIAALAILLAGVLVFVNTSAGRDWVSGYASLYSGQSVLIEGPVSVRFAPLGASFTRVAVAGDEGDPWLRLDRIGLTLPGLDWPPAIDEPLKVRVRGGELDVGAFRRARALIDDDEDAPSTALPELPFVVEGSVENFVVRTTNEMFPLMRVSLGELSLSPDSAHLRIDAALGDSALRAELALDRRQDTESEVAANLTGTFEFEGLSLAVRGMVADYVNLRGFDVVMTAGGDIGDRAGMTEAFTGENVTGRLTGDLGALTFDMERLEAFTRHGAIRLSARIHQDADRLIMDHGNLNVATEDLSAFLGDFNIASTLASPAELNAALQGGTDGVDVNRLRLTLGDDEVVVAGSGRLLRDPEGQARIEDAELSMVVEDSQSLLTVLGFDSPVVGRLSASASVRGTRERLSIDNVTVDLGTATLSASGNGTASWTDAGRELALDIQARGATIAAAVPRLAMPQWFGENGEGSATLTYDAGVFALSSLDARFESELGRAHVRGDILQLDNITADNLEVTLEATPVESDKPRGLDKLNLVLGLPQGLDAPGNVAIQGETGYGQFTFDGRIASPREQSGINGTFRFEADPDLIPGAGPGDDGGSVLQGDIAVIDVEQRSFEITAELVGTEGSLSYRGALDESFAGSGVLKVDGMNLNVLTALAGTNTDFPAVGDLQANIAHGTGSIELSDIVVATGGTRIQGGLSIVLPDAERSVVRVTIEATAEEVYLADLGMEGGQEDKTRYFSDAQLGLEGLNKADLDIRLNVARLHTKALDYQDVRLVGTSRSGVLQLSSTQQLLGGGGSKLDVKVDARGEAPDVGFVLSLDDIDPGYLRTIGDQEKYSGDVDVEVDLSGRGNSVREILGNANGHFLIRINHAVIPNRKLDLLSADFLFETLRTVNPFVRQSEEMDIECGLVAFVVRDGRARADKTVVIRGKRLLIVAEGEINLENEQVVMVIRPKAQEGIGLNTSGLVKFMGIGGTLTNPQIRTDPKGLFMTGASLGAAVASGGMSLFLQNIFDRLTTSARGCERIEAAFRDQLAAAPEVDRNKRPDQ